MKPEEIENGNKLIAEFDGYELIAGSEDSSIPGLYKKGDQTYNNIEDFKYRDDWNDLMRVIEKINSTKIPIEYYTRVRIELIIPLRETLIEVNINATYKAVIKFITWYNTNNK